MEREKKKEQNPPPPWLGTETKGKIGFILICKYFLLKCPFSQDINWTELLLPAGAGWKTCPYKLIPLLCHSPEIISCSLTASISLGIHWLWGH
jgi:hypothetical protein